MSASSCATISRGCAEPIHGTASRARRWILLEQPGAWGADAIASSDLPMEVAEHLRMLARGLPARVLMLRRSRGRVHPDARRSLYVGHTHPSRGWLEHLLLDDVRELLEVDLDALATGGSVGGEPVEEPLYLVCTNGSHDPCCAQHGLPVARALEEVVGPRVWECSHVGGDRFAGNLVCLPDGQFYGHLDPETARAAVAAHEDGRLLLERWRGRSSYSFVVQATEALVRQELGLDALDALRATSTSRDGGRHTVRFTLASGGELTAVVEEGRQDQARTLTCGGVPTHAPTFTLRRLDAPPAAR